MMSGHGDDGIMVSVKTAKLLEILQQNLLKHVEEYKQARIGYKLQVLEAANRLIVQFEKFDPHRLTERLEHAALNLVPPANYETDYLRAIGMLKLHTKEEMLLDASNYRKYVEDDWGRHSDVQRNRAYAAAAPAPR